MLGTKLHGMHPHLEISLLPFYHSRYLFDSYASFFVCSAINVVSVHQAESKCRTELAWREIQYNSRTIRDLDQLARTTASHDLEQHRVSSKPQNPSTRRYYLKIHTAAPFRFLIHMLAIVMPDVLACFPQWCRLHTFTTATRHTILYRRYRLATILQYIAFSS